VKRNLLLVIATTVMVLALTPTAWGQVWPSAQDPQKQPPPPPAATTTPKAKQDNQQTVTIQDFRFSPVELTVQPGTTVTWVNEGDAPHTVTADDGSFDSGRLQPGQSFSYTFQGQGTVAYHCEIHRQMTASVTVSAGGATTPAKEATKEQPTTQPSVEKETPTKQASSGGGWLTPALIVAVVVLAAALGWVLLRRRAS
jgi:plastocyanin